MQLGRQQKPPPTLRPDATREWAMGIYFRAYVLQKDRADVEPAARLFVHLRKMLNDPDFDAPVMLAERTERLYGRTLIRLGNPDGRDLILNVFESVGGNTASFDQPDDQRGRFLSDLTSDLTLIGAHDHAIQLTERAVEAANRPEMSARRLGNLAAWHLQRAVERRARADVGGWESDLVTAEARVAEALDLWTSLDTHVHPHALELREARAVRASIAVERAALERADVNAAMMELRELLRVSLPTPRAESYLQVLYRIGRLGVAHLRLGAAARARAYLEHAWRSSGNAAIRSWLALDLVEAIVADGDPDAAAEFADEAVRRFTPQCGSNYAPVVRLKTAVAAAPARTR